MPVHLTAPMSPRPRRPALIFTLQLLAIVAIALGAITLESTTSDSLAGATQEIAGP